MVANVVLNNKYWPVAALFGADNRRQIGEKTSPRFTDTSMLLPPYRSSNMGVCLALAGRESMTDLCIDLAHCYIARNQLVDFGSL